VRSASSIAFTGSESPTRNSTSSVGKFVGPFSCVSPSVVLGVCQPVKPGDVRGWRDHEHLCVLATMGADRLTQIGGGHGGSGDDEESTRHSLQPIRTDRAGSRSTNAVREGTTGGLGWPLVDGARADVRPKCFGGKIRLAGSGAASVSRVASSPRLSPRGSGASLLMEIQQAATICSSARRPCLAKSPFGAQILWQKRDRRTL
jgi:hypothetical protein